MQNRLRSKALWISVLAFLTFASKTYLHYDIPEGDKLIEYILMILTLAGIFNNPTDSDKF